MSDTQKKDFLQRKNDFRQSRFRHIFTKDEVTVVEIRKDRIHYEKDVKQISESGREIRRHSKPDYVFFQVYSPIR